MLSVKSAGFRLVFMAALCPLGAQAAEPSFESAAEAGALVVEMKGRIAVMADQRRSGGEFPLPPSYWVEGCEMVSFGPESGSLSEPVKLESVQYQEFCRGVDPDGAPNCWTDRVRVERRTIRVQVEGRGPLRGREREVFKVCLMETELQASLVRGTRGYDFILPGKSSEPIVARARNKFLSY